MKRVSEKKQKAIADLTLFNRKAAKLLNSGFVKHLSTHGLQVTFKHSPISGDRIETKLPDHEVMDAFVLNVRFLIQNNESCSIANVAMIYRDRTFPIPAALRRDYSWARAKWNQHLSKRSSSLRITGEDLSYRNIFYTFIYGNIAHEGPEESQRYMRWMKDTYTAALLWFEFGSCLLYFLHCVTFMKETNIRAISRLRR